MKYFIPIIVLILALIINTLLLNAKTAAIEKNNNYESIKISYKTDTYLCKRLAFSKYEKIDGTIIDESEFQLINKFNEEDCYNIKGPCQLEDNKEYTFDVADVSYQIFGQTNKKIFNIRAGLIKRADNIINKSNNNIYNYKIINYENLPLETFKANVKNSIINEYDDIVNEIKIQEHNLTIIIDVLEIGICILTIIFMACLNDNTKANKKACKDIMLKRISKSGEKDIKDVKITMKLTKEKKE